MKHINEYFELVEELPVLICKFKPDTTLTYVNKEYCKFFEKSPKELLGKKFLEFVPLEEIPQIKKYIKSRSLNNPAKLYIHTVNNSQNEKFVFQWTDKAIFTKKGKLKEFISYGYDITEKVRLQEECQKQREELKEINKNLKSEIIKNSRNIQKIKQKNIALEEVLKSIDKQKENLKQNIYEQLNIMVLPILKKLEIKCHNCNQDCKNKNKDYLQICTSEIEKIITLPDSYKSKFKIMDKLTPKEIEICQLIKKGLCSKEISQVLKITPATVEQHRFKIRKKLGVTKNLTTFLKNFRPKFYISFY